MNTKLSTKRKFKRMLVNILSIFVILAMAFPAAGSAYAQETALLEGWHDGMQGTVDANGCTAFGWAVNPDNRDQDVQVRILVDSNPEPVTTFAASDYGTDMDELGICPGGTCRFTVNLWDIVSLGEEHQITVQAYDEETANWRNLEGTPKSLTCSPHLEAFAWFDRYVLVDWPIDIPVTVTISNPDYEAEPFTPDDSRGWYAFYPGVDLQPGSIITATNGDITKILEISPLSATVDAGTGIVTGNATSDRTFHMRTDGDHFQLPIEQDITADSGGSWNTTIVDYLPWEWFTRGEMWEMDDDGDTTYAIWHVHQEVVEVWLAQNEIHAFGWPRDTDLEFYVDDTYLGTASTQPVDWYEGTWAVLNAGDFGMQLEPGMEVTVTDGIAPKSTTIQDLKITYANPGNDTVYGYAPANADLELGSWEDSPVFRFFNNGDDTNWMVDYKEPSLNGVTVDLNPGDELRLFMRDGEKDSTVWQSFVPNPFISVSLTEHWFWVNNYAPETLVTFSIYDNQGDETPILEFSKPADPSGNLTIEGWEHIWNPEPGDYIVATDGFTTKDLVLEYITLDVFDYDGDFLSGEGAYPGRSVDIGVGNESGEKWMNVTADENSRWEADFTLLDYEFDITENSWAGAHVNDEDGDVTAAHNSGPSEPPAWFTVFPEQEAVEGWDFPLGAIVHLAIDDPTTGGSPDYEQDEPVMFAPWGSWQLWVWFDFAGMYDVKAGDIVTMSYGETERTHIVQNLTVTKVAQEDDTVKGLADPGRDVYVWPHATGQEQLVIAKSNGNAQGKWNADFTGIFDLVPGECGRAEIRDEFSNRTAVDWCVPNPTFVAYMPVTIVGYDWPKGEINLSINDGEYTAQAEVGNADWDPTVVLFELWRDDFTMEAGDHIVMTDEAAYVSKELWVTNLAVTDFDFDAKQVFGNYDPAYDLWTWLYDLEGQVPETDPDNGTWVATFTELPPRAWGGATQWDIDGDGTSIDFQIPNTRVVIANQPDWVNSGITVSAGQSFTIEAFGLMNPCSDTYPNGDEICIFYTPVGADWLVPYENMFGIFPGPGLRFMGLLGRIGDGEPFYVGAGGTFTAEQSGTLWFTPNDNLRTDNQGAYSVLAWLEP